MAAAKALNTAGDYTEVSALFTFLLLFVASLFLQKEAPRDSLTQVRVYVHVTHHQSYSIHHHNHQSPTTQIPAVARLINSINPPQFHQKLINQLSYQPILSNPPPQSPTTQIPAVARLIVTVRDGVLTFEQLEPLQILDFLGLLGEWVGG